MTQVETAKHVQSPKDRIIVALDVPSGDEALAIVSELSGRVGAFKIGLELFVSEGPGFVRRLVDDGNRIFLDLKFHDIPNTVAMAAVQASKLDVWMLNIHASGGEQMMRRTVEEVAASALKRNSPRPLVIGVTVLTSMDQAALSSTGIVQPLERQVTSLARQAAAAGLDGVVASARESSSIREAVLDRSFLIVTPGIRLKHGTRDDQERVTTFGQALTDGSDYVVIGRPITRAADRVGALNQILSEID